MVICRFVKESSLTTATFSARLGSPTRRLITRRCTINNYTMIFCTSAYQAISLTGRDRSTGVAGQHDTLNELSSSRTSRPAREMKEAYVARSFQLRVHSSLSATDIDDDAFDKIESKSESPKLVYLRSKQTRSGSTQKASGEDRSITSALPWSPTAAIKDPKSSAGLLTKGPTKLTRCSSEGPITRREVVPARIAFWLKHVAVGDINDEKVVESFPKLSDDFVEMCETPPRSFQHWSADSSRSHLADPDTSSRFQHWSADSSGSQSEDPDTSRSFRHRSAEYE